MRKLFDIDSLENVFLTFQLNPKFEFENVNQKFLDNLGIEYEDKLKRVPLSDLLIFDSMDDLPAFGPMRQLLEMGLVYEGDLAIRNFKGEHFWLHAIVTSVAEGGYIGICTDITTRKKRLLEFDTHQENLAFTSQLAAIGEISANIAHEIRNPLTVISLCNDRVSEVVKDNPKARNLVNSISRSVAKLDRISTSMLKFSRNSTGQEQERFELAELLNEVREFSSHKMKLHGVDLSIIPPNHDIALNGDQTQLLQVLLNLINNAKDALLKEKEKRIILSCSYNEGHVFVRVLDSGPGVPVKNQAKIFDSFFTTKPKGAGTGLGLSLVRKIVRSHGGEVTYKVVSGLTCFEVRLPCHLIDEKSDEKSDVSENAA